jgi:glycosyltransferase involved in cell wall biosynthesis
MAPDVSVVVPSHAREGRLRTLLDALTGQTLARERWELIVVHTYDPSLAEGLFGGRELTEVRVEHAQARPSIQRNVGWRTAGGDRIAFVDDDCRPEGDWLERLLATSLAHPGDIVQGATKPEPRELHLFEHPHFRALAVDPPDERMQTCNILYERALLERLGGFDERAITGEDIDLGIRARDSGAGLVAALDAVVYHGIDVLSLTGKIRSQVKWQHLAYVVKRHPQLRERCDWGIWWKPEHLRATVSLVALAGAPRRPWMLVGVIPYVRLERWRHGPSKRQQLRSIRELPSHFLVELAEVATLVAGSVRYRTVLL